MYIKVNDERIAIKNVDNHGTSVLLWVDAPLTEPEALNGDVLRVMDEEDNPIMETLQPLGALTLVGYRYELRTEKEATLAEQVEEMEGLITGHLETIREQEEYAEWIIAELALREAEVDDILQTVRDGLLAIPVPGEAWDNRKWYIGGDVVTHGGLRYEALITCKGKEPGVEDGCWTELPEEAPVVLVWADIPSGTPIAIGDLVTHADKIYRCIKAHTKSAIRIVTNTDYWEAA